MFFRRLPGDRTARVVAEVQRQADLVGRYLRSTGYYLVRPCGGFAFHGSIETNPALEYPLATALARITGNPPQTYLCDRTATSAPRWTSPVMGRGPRHFHPTPDQLIFQPGVDWAAFMSDPEHYPQTPYAQAAGALIGGELMSLGATAVQVVTGIGKAALFADRIDVLFEDTAFQKRGMIALSAGTNWLARCHPGNLALPGTGALTIFEAWMSVPPHDDFKPLLALTTLPDVPDPGPVPRRRGPVATGRRRAVIRFPDRSPRAITSGSDIWVAHDMIGAPVRSGGAWIGATGGHSAGGAPAVRLRPR